MRLQVRVLPAGRDESIDLAAGGDGAALFQALGLNQEAHLLLRGDTPLPADAPLRTGDRLTVVSVISGG